MKKIIMITLILVLASIVFINSSYSKPKSYYSGDAINFQDQLYLGTTNTGSLEIWRLENKELLSLSKIRPLNERFGTYDNFYDLKFVIETDRLFVYAVNGFSIYKYEIAGDKLSLVFNKKNTYWEWYNRIDKFGDRLVTISERGVKIWNDQPDVVNSYDYFNKETPYNIRAYNDRYILNVQDNSLQIFNRDNRQLLRSISVNYRNSLGNRQVYQDENDDLYIVDDYYAKKFNMNGELLGSFQHLNYDGYDVSASDYNDYIYFSNGVGVVKLNKNTMKQVDYAWTTSLGGAESWAMGIKTVYLNGDKLVVFNNSNILILDDNLNKIAQVRADEEDNSYSLENLYLNIDKNAGTPGMTITLNGGGYLPNEKIKILFAGQENLSQVDSRGRFNKTLIVPDVKPGGVDIKVDGVDSKLTYSISFKVLTK